MSYDDKGVFTVEPEVLRRRESLAKFMGWKETKLMVGAKVYNYENKSYFSTPDNINNEMLNLILITKIGSVKKNTILFDGKAICQFSQSPMVKLEEAIYKLFTVNIFKDVMKDALEETNKLPYSCNPPRLVLTAI